MSVRFDASIAADLNARFAEAAAQHVLQWALEESGGRFVLASSFGAEDVTLIDMLWRLKHDATVVTLDTLRLHTETYQVMDDVRRRYPGLDLQIFYPDLPVLDAFIKERGYNAFYQGIDERKACCGVRKVEPLERALRGVDVWATGMRRDQAATRTTIDRFEIDDVHGGILKLNPLADWTQDQVWDYIKAHDVPYNALHDQGFPSIGCAPCTRAVEPGEDPRAGRWWWELDPESKECGIHIGYDASGNAVIQRVAKV